MFTQSQVSVRDLRRGFHVVKVDSLPWKRTGAGGKRARMQWDCRGRRGGARMKPGIRFELDPVSEGDRLAFEAMSAWRD
jgi:hypothetical protein